jgi:hypothetical protein
MAFCSTESEKCHFRFPHKSMTYITGHYQSLIWAPHPGRIDDFSQSHQVTILNQEVIIGNTQIRHKENSPEREKTAH